MADRTVLIAQLEAAVFAMERPVSHEQVLAQAFAILRPVDPIALNNFRAWFEKHGNTLMRILNG